MKKKLVATAAAAAMALGLLAAPAVSARPALGAADAAPVDLACLANSQLNFSPPLTASNLSARVSLTKGFVGCLSPSGRYSRLKSGYGAGTGTVKLAASGIPCLPLLSLTITGVIVWSPSGERSAFTEVISTDPSTGALVVKETVTSGPLAGDKVLAAGPVAPNLDCALNGLSTIGAPLHLSAFA